MGFAVHLRLSRRKRLDAVQTVGNATFAELVLSPRNAALPAIWEPLATVMLGLAFYANASGANTSFFASGFASLAGIARIDFQSPPVVGTTLTLVEASAISGTFASYDSNVPDLTGTFGYSSTNVTFTVTSSDGLFRDGFEELTGTSCASAFAK